MQVVFRVNLGLIDAKSMKLNAAECKAGMSANIEDAAAETLIRRGVAMRASDAGKDELITSIREEQKRKAEADEKKIAAVAKKPELTGPAK